MLYLWASLAALAVGPALVALAGRRAWALAALDAFVLVTVGGLVALDILPEACRALGWPALVAAAAGLLAPALLHGALLPCAGGSAQPLLGAALLALGGHAFMDGVALLQGAQGGAALARAVVLHRALEGLAIWWLLRRHEGRGRSLALVGVVAAATVAGFVAGERAVGAGLGDLILFAQVAVAGSLLHVLLRHGPPSPAAAAQAHSGAAYASGLAGLAAMAALLALEGPRGSGEGSAAGGAFVSLAAAAAVPLLLAQLAGAVAHGWLPAAARLLRPRRPRPGTLAGALGGLAEAMCACGVLPLYRRLAAAALPRATALAYLAAAPAMGPATLLLSWVYLGPALALLRLGGVVAVAAASGWLAARAAAPSADVAPADAAPGPPGATPPAAPGVCRRAADAAHFAAGEALDHAAPWALLGLGLAAFVLLHVPASWLHGLQQRGIEVPVLALVGLPFYLSAPAATFVAAALASKGGSSGAVLAFVLTASAFGLGVGGMLQRTVGRRAALRFAAAVLAGASAVGAAVAALPPALPLAPPAPVLPETGAGLAAVAALAAMSLLRQGVRPFLEQVAVPNTAHRRGHHHHA